jgi:Excreted virulence factor EspC, type VII ESX diderm
VTGTLTVKPQTMRDTATGLSDAATQLHGNGAGAALSGAAGPVPALATASACTQVGASLAQQAQSLGNDVSAYSGKLLVAADRYERGDNEAAERIDFTGPEEPPPPNPHPPVNEYEQALHDAGLLDGPATGHYRQWLDNASKNGVPPQTIVDIARQQHITPEDFRVLDGMKEVKDPDGKSFFIIPSGTSAADMKKAALMTYVLNAGTGYDAAKLGPDKLPGTADDVKNDFEETPYSAAEVQRIVDRQNANSWSYTALAEAGGGASMATTPNGMLMGLGGDLVNTISNQGGTTYGDIFTVNIDGAKDPEKVLTAMIGSGTSWYQGSDGLPQQDAGLDLDRLLHHEERHSEQWAQKGFATMARDYGLGWIIQQQTGTNPLERDAGLSDGGYR